MCSFIAFTNTSKIFNFGMSAASTGHNKPSGMKKNEKFDYQNHGCLFVRFWNAKCYITNEHWLKELVHQYISDIKQIIVYEEGKYTSYGKIEFESHSVAKIVLQELLCHEVLQVRYWKLSDAPTSKIPQVALNKSSSKNELIPEKCTPSCSDTGEVNFLHSKSKIKCAPLISEKVETNIPPHKERLIEGFHQVLSKLHHFSLNWLSPTYHCIKRV